MNEQIASIQWFPGHMAKTRRIMKENLKLVDAVIELRDARIPYSSENPEIAKLIDKKTRIILLAKPDLADPNITATWIKHYQSKDTPSLTMDCKNGKNIPELIDLVKKTLAPLLEYRISRGMGGLPTRMMIVGVPNVGKSSLINRLAKGRRVKVEDRPGVTREKQWIKVDGGIELLDMPGVLWPKFEDRIAGENLALTGAVKDDVVDVESLAMRLLWRLHEEYPKLLSERYGLVEKELEGLDSYGILELVCKKRGMLVRGGDYDTERGANMILDEFRSGKIGRISLESPR